MDAEAAKYIGAGLAAIGMGFAAIAVGTLFALFLQIARPAAAQGVIEGPPYHCDINAMRALFPNDYWFWPKPPYDRLPHPAAAAELPVILTRRDRA